MSEDCEYCGNGPGTFQSTNVLCGKKNHTHKNSGSSWWCFGTKKKSNPRECADDGVVVGKYEKRRSTLAYSHRISNFSGVKKKIQDCRFVLSPPVKSNLKLLLVFDIADLTYEALRKASEKLGFEITQCSTKESAFDEFQSKHHDLIVIDTRTKNFEHFVLCRALSSAKGIHHAPIVAIVKRSLFERDEEAVRNLFDYGYKRCLVESSSVTNYVNELMQLKLSDMKSMAQKSVCQTLYTALDKCNNLVFITDDNFKCQYSNVLVEKVLNESQEEILGHNMSEDILCDHSQLNMMSSVLMRNREWNGSVTMKKKNSELINLECKVTPIACFGRCATHFVFNVDLTNENSRASTDKRMSNFRKVSLNKLKALPLEAPITKIIMLMDEVRQKVIGNFELVELLNNAEDLLRNSELYSTHVKQNHWIKPNEPVVSELITALLSDQALQVKPNVVVSRRGSRDSAVYRISKTMKVSEEMETVLSTAFRWDFEIFQLEELSKHRPLQTLGMHLCQQFNVANCLQCDEITLRNWLVVIESHYHTDNFYHNSTHATDVMQATAGFLRTERIRAIMEPLDEAMCLLAAASHDVDHPGKSSAFLANSDNEWAILYNDVSILENHHAAFMFQLTLGDDRVNIFKNLDRDMYKIVRSNMIDMILATEMTKHFEHLSKFVNVFCTTEENIDDNGDDFVTISSPDNIALIKRMLIKCADVSNPTRPFRIYVEWTRRIAEEYFQQTDEEKIRGLPVVMPMFDRNTCSVPKSQIGFVDYIVNDMFEAWNAFVDMPELINYLRQNYIRWKEFDENGHKTLADIRMLQSSAMLAPVLPFKPKIVNN